MSEPDLGTQLRELNEPKRRPRKWPIFLRPLDALDALGRRYPRFLGALSLAIGGVAVGYLWAELFGDGLRGGKTGEALDNSNTYPNANAAILGVIVLLFASLFIWANSSGRDRGGTGMRIWAVSIPVIGLLLFAVSRLFI
jgi:hypothetical protein